MTKNCLFCKIANKEIPAHLILETKQAMAFLDIYPQTKGHTLVIPKKHSFNLLDTKDLDVAAVHQLAKQVCLLLQKTLKVNNFLVKSHNGALAGQEIDHFHVHVIPCYDKHSRHSKRSAPSQAELNKMQKNITSHLD